ncbi:hypothetical protein H6P81_015858 [Aristolochia fimbriata]|uniref:Pentatricopeptide repeat-containing protein n=1 Tax=Aristolochia fimbriata TaxID=158543 RepID=A0AAV7E6Q8_ARIFI|nr:hypothetical protein H6P81_015858 [Aristolochia fimbriata]
MPAPAPLIGAAIGFSAQNPSLIPILHKPLISQASYIRCSLPTNFTEPAISKEHKTYNKEHKLELTLDVYKLLVRTYSKEHKFKEAKVLLRQMRKIGWLKNFWDEEAISACLEQDKNAIPEYDGIKKSSLAYFLSIGAKEIDSKEAL